MILPYDSPGAASTTLSCRISSCETEIELLLGLPCTEVLGGDVEDTLLFLNRDANKVARLARPAMNSLPSYEEATQGPDWLDLVAPHIGIQDYARLSRVSSRFYRYFASRLWHDPLATNLRLGRGPDDGKISRSFAFLLLEVLY